MDAEEAGKLYCRMMNDVKSRLRQLDGLSVLSTPGVFVPPVMYEVEAAMLSIRKVLELIAFSSLVTNEEAMRSATKDIGRLWRAKDILDRIEALNPGFFPVPIRIANLAGGVGHFYPLPEDVAFRRSDFADLYDACGYFLHIQNPFSAKGPPDLKRSPRTWLKLIRKLLKVHQVTLIGGEMGIVTMNSWDGTPVTFHHAGPVDKVHPEWGHATALSAPGSV